MRNPLKNTVAAVFASVVLVAALSGTVATASNRPGGDTATTSNNVGSDVAALYRLQARFHESLSGGGDINNMMSLWTGDATFSAGGTTYKGKTEIRAFFLQSPGFTNNWVSVSPTFKDRFHVHGKTADIYFECHFVDWQSDPEVVVTHSSLDGAVRKVHGRWLFWHVTATAITLTP